jgi:hypothetical protein
MKLSLKLALAALVLAVPAHAGVLITPSLFGNSSTMPGQITDFTFFGNPLQFPKGDGSITYNYTSGTATQPSLLTDFIPVVGANATATYGAENNVGGTNYNPAYGSITDPAGTLEKTGTIFQNSSLGSTANDLASFILGPNTGTFNFADFTVYVMISNAPGAGLNDIDLSAQVEDATDAVGLTPVVSMSIVDNTTTVGTATFAQFHITGAASGDVLQLGAVGAAGTSPYLSGVSFKSNAAPEPSTTAMIAGSMVLLALGLRQARRATATDL